MEEVGVKRIFTAVLLAAALLFLTGCGAAKSLTQLPEPSESVEAFFDCLKREDYAGVDELVYNYTTLGMAEIDANASDSDTATDVLLYELLRDNREYKLGTAEINGRDAKADLSLTTLDYRKLTEPLGEKVTEAVKAAKYRGQTFQSASDINPVINSELEKLMEVSGSDMMTTEKFELEMKYSDKKWKLVISDELYKALIGYIM